MTTINLVDVAQRLPRLALDAPSLVQGALGFLRKPSSKTSIGLIFQRHAARQPDKPFLRFEGESISYGAANETVNRYAAVLAERGVRRGDVVAVLAKNHPSTLLVALAAVKLGAAAGMLNTNQRGEMLDHSVTLLRSAVLVVDEECADAVDALGDDATGQVLPLSELDELAAGADAADPPVCARIEAHETAFYIFTSGTTGLPKASTMSHYRWLKSMSGIGNLGVRLHRADTLYCCLPLYHNNALTVSLSSVLSAGAALAIGRSFSASKFWDDVIRNEATAFCYIGEICRYLLNQPERDTDRAHQVRVIVGNGLRPQIWTEFTERFGIDRVAEFYGASECNVAFVNAFNIEKTAGVCPLPYAVVEYHPDTGKPARGGDGKLVRVGKGEVGLLLSKVTDRSPFDGYTDEKATNDKLVRGGFAKDDCWFDTGDLVRRQGWLHVAFVDRLGDTFRWKGENVATTEVEGALSAHPDLDETVVFGVEVPGTDGKAGMAVVTLREGRSFDGSALAEHLYGRLPGYAVPLFVRVVDSLEHTSTFKSRKVELRKTGYEADDVHVLAGRSDGYREFYDSYVDEVASGQRPTA